MAQARRKKPDAIPLTLHVARGLREGIFLVLFALAVYLLISLVSYHSGDPGWSHSDASAEVVNRGGVAGAWFADVFLYLFGYPAYLFPVMVGYSGWLVFHGRMAGEGVDAHVLILRWTGFVVTVVAACGLAALHYDIPPDRLPLNAGGILGDVAYGALVSAFSFLGATLFLLALFFAGVTLFTGLSWVAVTDHIGRLTLGLLAQVRGLFRWAWEFFEGRRVRSEREDLIKLEQEKIQRRKPVRIEPVIRSGTMIGERVERERQVPLFDPPADTELPPLSLLDDPPPRQEGYSKEALEAMSRLVEIKLADFGVEVEVVAVHPGPVVTRFEAQPGPGVKVSQITNLAKDLARSLSTLSVRVVEVIPGKSVIGLEIPNEYRELVALSEILRSADYDQATSPLTLALGKDIGGNPVVADLTRMPHLLVAGTTGSGKSVAINGMVLSLLYKTLPTDVRLIMIDPKMLELSVYEGIPHLLTPVVTDMREAATALRWCVGEMERRYKLMAALGVRNIAGYNRKVKQAEEKGKPIPDPLFNPEQAEEGAKPLDLQPLPFIVVIVDELADMMMVVGKKVEQLIARLAQKARAAGVHLILATQRPSVDVITGLIKANIPARIAFQVSARVDSRTILDQMGADQLLGHGDMLYLPPGLGVPMRVHGAFVSDQEVHKVVAHLRGKSEPIYLDEVLSGTDNGADLSAELPESDGESDPLYDQAVVIVTKTRKASISGVQRRLKIGYNRAARMIEQMEVSGIVGPLQSNGSREVIAAKPPDS